jgi:hypothetical protein
MICVGIVPGRRQPCKVTHSSGFTVPILFLFSFARKMTWFSLSWQEVSAAPAVCDGTLFGILSYADGCVLRADVGIYTSIFHYIEWIEHTIQNN